MRNKVLSGVYISTPDCVTCDCWHNALCLRCQLFSKHVRIYTI